MRDGIQAEADKMGIKVDIYAANTEDDVEGLSLIHICRPASSRRR